MSDVLVRTSPGNLSDESVRRQQGELREVCFLSTTETLSPFHLLAPASRPGRGPSREGVYGLLEPLIALEDNWDCEGALAPTVASLRLASQFLYPLQGVLPRPDILPSVYGGVLIEWESDDVDLLFEIASGGTVHVYLRVFDIEEEGPVVDHEDAVVFAFQTLSGAR